MTSTNSLGSRFLDGRRAVLEELLSKIELNLRRSICDEYDRLPELVDESNRIYRSRLSESIRDVNRNFLRSVRIALESIDSGTYGVCQECESEISERRLLVSPWAVLCIECAEKLEREA